MISFSDNNIPVNPWIDFLEFILKIWTSLTGHHIWLVGCHKYGIRLEVSKTGHWSKLMSLSFILLTLKLSLNRYFQRFAATLIVSVCSQYLSACVFTLNDRVVYVIWRGSHYLNRIRYRCIYLWRLDFHQTLQSCKCLTSFRLIRSTQNWKQHRKQKSQSFFL